MVARFLAMQDTRRNAGPGQSERGWVEIARFLERGASPLGGGVMLCAPVELGPAARAAGLRKHVGDAAGLRSQVDGPLSFVLRRTGATVVGWDDAENTRKKSPPRRDPVLAENSIPDPGSSGAAMAGLPGHCPHRGCLVAVDHARLVPEDTFGRPFPLFSVLPFLVAKRGGAILPPRLLAPALHTGARDAGSEAVPLFPNQFHIAEAGAA